MVGTAVALAMVVAALAALGCSLADRPRRLRSIVASVIMFVAMADMALGHLLLSSVGWAALLIMLAVFMAVQPRADEPSGAWHHSLALLAAALIMISAPHGRSVTAAGEHAGHPVAAALPYGGWLLSLLIISAYVIMVVRPLLRASGDGPADTRSGRVRAPVAGVAATASCLTLMAVLPLVS